MHIFCALHRISHNTNTMSANYRFVSFIKYSWISLIIVHKLMNESRTCLLFGHKIGCKQNFVRNFFPHVLKRKSQLNSASAFTSSPGAWITMFQWQMNKTENSWIYTWMAEHKNNAIKVLSNTIVCAMDIFIGTGNLTENAIISYYFDDNRCNMDSNTHRQYFECK